MRGLPFGNLSPFFHMEKKHKDGFYYTHTRVYKSDEMVFKYWFNGKNRIAIKRIK